jgi:hypothetical protein
MICLFFVMLYMLSVCCLRAVSVCLCSCRCLLSILTLPSIQLPCTYTPVYIYIYVETASPCPCCQDKDVFTLQGIRPYPSFYSQARQECHLRVSRNSIHGMFEITFLLLHLTCVIPHHRCTPLLALRQCIMFLTSLSVSLKLS